MKFKINKEHFSVGLQQVLNVVGSRASMQILNNVMLEAKNDHIELTTTNLDLGIRCSIKAEIDTQGGITVPVRKLANIIRSLPNDETLVEMTSSTQLKVTSGGSNFKIMGIPKEEFPPLPTFEDQKNFTLAQTDLTQMLKSVSYAQSSDENRHILNGVYFDFADGKMMLVATDGRRLALVSKETEVAEENAGKLILPAKTVNELQRILGQGEDVKIAFNDRQVAFEIGIENSENSGMKDRIYLVSKIVEGNYPNYQQVIPKETEHRISVERELMLECVQRAALMTNDKNHSIKVKIGKNLLEISSSSRDLGESHETMAVAYDGPEVEVALNPQFVMDPLKALEKDEVYFEFKDELSPGVFKTLDSFLCVIMPLRLN